MGIDNLQLHVIHFPPHEGHSNTSMYLGRDGFVKDLDSDQVRVFAGRTTMDVWLLPLLGQNWPGPDLRILDVELTELDAAFARVEVKPNSEVCL